ncbi:MAG TPA: hypothetical protein VKU02_04225 [Gemmataceae bacterium]|nr:hypothetical protein [Gemmataceae bacterium]
MMRFRYLGIILGAPVLAVALSMTGCGGSDTKPTQSSSGKKSEGDKKSEKTSDSGSASSSGAKTGIKPTGFAIIKGKITYDGDPPPVADIPIPDDNKDKAYCLKGPHTVQTWIVGADKGVKNVVLWVRAPAGKYFEIPPEQQKPATPIVKIDQPHCAFEPHVDIAFPSYFDGKAQQRTGQKLEIANSAEITHNTNWTPSNTLLDSAANVILPSKQAPTEIPLFESVNAKKRSGLEDLLTLKCNIHQWMTGYVWAFDHPYAAKTGDDGTYEIKNVPAGTELHLVGWHEGVDGGYFLPGKSKGESIGPLKENEIKELNFKIKK